MPNHVINNVYMRGIGTRKDLFIEEDRYYSLDFNKIIPMPEELNIPSPISDAAIDLAIKALMIRMSASPIYDYNGEYRKFADELSKIPIELPKYYEGNEVQALEDGLAYINNVIKYGYPTWYEWCTYTWGTKWNSYWGKIIDDNNISFTTAWDIPYNIYIMLSQQNPYDEIRVNWDNEGGIFGETRFLDGDMIEEKVYRFSDDNDWDSNKLFMHTEMIEHHSTKKEN